MNLNDKVRWQGEDGPMVGTIMRVVAPWVDPWNRQALAGSRQPGAPAPIIEKRDHESFVVLGQPAATVGDDAKLALHWPQVGALAPA